MGRCAGGSMGQGSTGGAGKPVTPVRCLNLFCSQYEEERREEDCEGGYGVGNCISVKMQCRGKHK